MNLLKLVALILLSFFAHLSANASEDSFLQLDRELRELHVGLKRDFVKPAQKKKLKERLVVSLSERAAVIELLEKYKMVFDKVQSLSGKKSLIPFGSTRAKVHKRVLVKLMLYSHGARLFSELLSYPALLGLVKEHQNLGSIESDYLHNFIMSIAKESHRSIRQGSRRHYWQLRRPKIADFLANPVAFNRWLKSFKVSTEEKQLASVLLEEYVQSIREFNKKQRDLMSYRIFSKYLYNIKASAMTWLGDIALRDKNVLGKTYLEKMESILMPGDIGIINQDGRLSNLVFTGMWSHGLLYLGPGEQFKEVFSNDEETNQLYQKKCQNLKLDCESYLDYMRESFPKSFAKYIDSAGTDKQLTVIEANSEGVVLSTTKYALAFNRVTTFRPRLKLKDKAMAIEEAFRNYGKPYDFNFDNRTYGRIVCTELVLYSYMPDPELQKEGLEWFMTVVSGAPVLYGYDVVETFFEVKEEDRKLDFLFYYESPREGGGVKEMTLVDLRKTVRPKLQ